MNDDAIAAMPRLHDVFDLVYADPPYGYERYDELLLTIDERLKLRNGTLVVVEHRRRTEPFPAEPRRLTRIRRADYGEVSLTFFTKAENA